ncbi:hypothetical protein L226DRAFT_313768 [Lentinus tigrinus ALCF2SS1-7]|uniref:uncharacterized protein n=1 Tax=Lentinus tigrinus ALCF2SS1-7 TaxID=1328758 RepID=UPI001166390C|nr:hypothetical protein L226DRAFT_313768 [Lentinus tigrinus ALCF2SS1-7]
MLTMSYIAQVPPAAVGDSAEGHCPTRTVQGRAVELELLLRRVEPEHGAIELKAYEKPSRTIRVGYVSTYCMSSKTGWSRGIVVFNRITSASSSEQEAEITLERMEDAILFRRKLRMVYQVSRIPRETKEQGCTMLRWQNDPGSGEINTCSDDMHTYDMDGDRFLRRPTHGL